MLFARHAQKIGCHALCNCHRPCRVVLGAVSWWFDVCSLRAKSKKLKRGGRRADIQIVDSRTLAFSAARFEKEVVWESSKENGESNEQREKQG